MGDLKAGPIYFLYAVLFVAGTFSFAMGLRSGSRSLKWRAYGIFFTALVLLQILSDLLGAEQKYLSVIREIPTLIFALATLLVITFDLWLFGKLESHQAQQLTEAAIKESMDTLPVGVAFSDERGRPYLVNYKIDQLSRLVFGRNLVNTLDFFDPAMEGELVEGATTLKRISKDRVVMDAQGVWLIENIRHGPIVETLARDVTEAYGLIQEIRENNRKIRQLNQNLKDYSKNIKGFIREREVLSAKRKIHDDMGRSLILFRMYMEQEPKTARQRRELTLLWRQNILLLKGGMARSPKGSPWEKLTEAARDAGMAIEMTGSLPSEARAQAILTEILHESINNAILHGHAKTLYLDLTEDGGQYHFTIGNDGAAPEGPIVEKGGLKNIRKLVEMEGGSVTIRESLDFVMNIALPKGVRDET
ncbi:MAG: hypothetical protein Q4E76_01185 [Tissierellia bacterium]|nr:hypothetical protein [Tissierellia bacterium]